MPTIPSILMTVGQGILDFVQSLVPVDKWLQALSNVLRYLGLSFILLILLFLAVFFGGSRGLSADQRFLLLVIILSLIGIGLLIVLALAARSGDLLLSPRERSLGRGQRYGTKAKPRPRKEAMELPSDPDRPGLPSPAEPKKLPKEPAEK